MKLVKLLVSLIGINPRALLALRFLPRYLAEKKRFQARGGVIGEQFLILTDYEDSAGVAKGHYFHQDLLIAQKIFANSPKRHVDIGSRVDGFVAHVAAFREIELFDIRPLKATITNVTFQIHNLLDLPEDMHEYSDSVSCLHALEHFGLGRYGDPIDPDGHIKGFNNLINLTRPGGKLYVSVPVGRKRTVFNAHRVMAPSELIGLAAGKLILQSYSYVDDRGDLWVGQDTESFLAESDGLDYGLGIYEFRKVV
jgi:hypothetical protein